MIAITTILHTLIGMRDLLTQPSEWTTGAAARNAAGDRVDPIDPNAARFSLAGAALYGPRTRHEANAAADAIIRVSRRVYGPEINPFSDARTHAEALHLLDITIEDVRGAL
jgi:hypothetical protein